MPRKYQLPIELRKENGDYTAKCLAIQGCQAKGQTITEALERLESIITMWVELHRDRAPMPDAFSTQIPQTDLVFSGNFVVDFPS